MLDEGRSLLEQDHALNEWLHAQLIIALNKSGRRGDALGAYQDLRRLLSTELGLDPSADLQRIHELLLTSDGRPSMALEIA